MKVIMNCASMAVEDLHEGNWEISSFANASERCLDQDIPFVEYLKKQKLNDQLCHLILNSISMVDYDATTKEVRRVKSSVDQWWNFRLSLGLYQSQTIFGFDWTLWKFAILVSNVWQW